MDNKKCYAYVSSWSHGKGDSGLWVYSFNEETGEITEKGCLDDKTECGVSFADDKRQILYVLDESVDLPGKQGGGGRVLAFRLESDGSGTMISEARTCCPNPSYVTEDSSGKYLLVSNHGGRACVTKILRGEDNKYRPCVEYDDSAVELFGINEDGSIGEILDVVKHTGSGPDKRKQSNAHPHCVVMSPDGKLFAVCDKGNDGVYMYRIDREKERLVETGTCYRTEPGSEPRFGAFHPNGKFFYQNNEGKPVVNAYTYDDNGTLRLIGSYDVFSEAKQNVEGEKVQQGLCMDQAGQYLYSVTHDPAMIIVFKIDQVSGALELIQNKRINAEWPRGCALSPNGGFLAVTGMKSGNVISLAVGEDGTLTDTGFSVNQAGAAYITFFEG